jgi:hypothetical protein
MIRGPAGVAKLATGGPLFKLAVKDLSGYLLKLMKVSSLRIGSRRDGRHFWT